MMATTASGQASHFLNANVGGDTQSGNSWVTPKDSTSAGFIPDSLTATLYYGWVKEPGQMPVYNPGLLPNSMPILNPPPVDEGMILRIGLESKDAISDSLQLPKSGKK